MEGGTKKSWWLTLPGLLTAAGGFIAAVTTSFATLNAIFNWTDPVAVSPPQSSQLPLHRTRHLF
jgi:hypothetical protein